MSAAVASLAYGARLPAIEANVERVVSRLFAIPGDAGSPLRQTVARAPKSSCRGCAPET